MVVQQLDKLYAGKGQDYRHDEDSKNPTRSCVDHVFASEVELWQSLAENVQLMADIICRPCVLLLQSLLCLHLFLNRNVNSYKNII